MIPSTSIPSEATSTTTQSVPSIPTHSHTHPQSDCYDIDLSTYMPYVHGDTAVDVGLW